MTDFYDTSLLPGCISPTPQTAASSCEFVSYTIPPAPAFTPASELKRTDGSIGTLSIPSLSISMKAYEGTGSDSMNKGLGHFPETSGWDGNIGLCGHNRGAVYTIGSIKELKIGDVIQYTTALGTRTYSVSFVGTISGSDWSLLFQTSDNRITLITCLADQPAMRVAVQAIETK